MPNINVVAEFSGERLKLYKRGYGLVYNAVIDENTKKNIRNVVTEQEQRKIAVVAGAGATEERTAGEKALLYDLGFSELVYLQPAVALLGTMNYHFTENTPLLSVVIGEDGTDLAIVLGEKILYSGILDVGVNACIEAIGAFVVEKFHAEIDWETSRDIFWDIASLVPKDTRFAKFPDFIIKAEQVSGAVYPQYEKIIGAINHLVAGASVEVIRQINKTGVIFGGIGAQIQGLPDAVYSVIGLQSLIGEDPANATILGAGALLDNPKLLLKLAEKA